MDIATEMARHPEPAQTKDGHRITLLATVDGPRDVPAALAAGAQGVGLFRTESLVPATDGVNDTVAEDKLVAIYRAVFEAFGPGRPVIVRLATPPAAASSLTSPVGVTGIRATRAERQPVLRQLRAISRGAAAAGGDIVPAVTASTMATLADVDLLNDLVREAQASLAADNLAAAPTVRTGVTAGIVSVAFMTRDMAPRVDFFTIATDELTQHLLAVDPRDPALADLLDPLHPAVVRAIRMIAGVAAAAQRAVSASGTLAADPVGALVLVGLGVDELSADAASLEPLRRALASVTYEDLQRLAGRALDCGDAATVRAFATRLANRDSPAR